MRKRGGGVDMTAVAPRRRLRGSARVPWGLCAREVRLCSMAVPGLWDRGCQGGVAEE